MLLWSLTHRHKLLDCTFHVVFNNCGVTQTFNISLTLIFSVELAIGLYLVGNTVLVIQLDKSSETSLICN